MKRSADISECGRYRWWLRRDWSGMFDEVRVVTFIMLNPSTADHRQDDPTIRRCIGFAKAWGFNALSVRNLFPWRATDPRELFKAEAPVGGSRGDAELLAAMASDMIVCAWGGKVPFGRDRDALDLLSGCKLFCLGKTKGGHPRHPLYVRGDAQPTLFSGSDS